MRTFRLALLAAVIANASCWLRAAEEPASTGSLTPRWGERPVASEQSGWLKRNPEPQRSSAPWVLTDKQGQVRYYVTPQQGVELSDMLDRRVLLRGEAYPPTRRFLAASAIDLEARGSGAKRSLSNSPPGTAKGAGLAAALMTDNSPPEKDSFLPATPAAYQEPVEEELPPGTELLGPGTRADDAIVSDLGEFIVPTEEHADVGLWGPAGFGSWCSGPCGPISPFWVRGQYLAWSIRGMNTPPLVTASVAGTPRDQAGVLGFAGTTILFGGDELDGDSFDGYRIIAGAWLNTCGTVGIEGEYWSLGAENAGFQASSTGTPILGRPFYDIVAGRETSELVAFPQILEGTVTVDAVTDLQSAGVRLLWNACCCAYELDDPCNRCQLHRIGKRMDWIIGYRRMDLEEVLSVREDLESNDPQNPGSFVVRDRFETTNEFDGAELGVQWQVQHSCWSFDVVHKIALGNNQQKVVILGATDITQNNVTTPQVGGLLAQRTNIGTYTRDEFSVIPELGVTLGCQLTPCLRATVGYTFIYWGGVIRPGDQIDRDINPNLIPPENPVQTTHLRPEFAFNETDLWIQGVNVGLDYRW